MRQIVLDTETTGLEPAEGHRIIEIGCVEIINRRLTGNHFHHYLQPDRAIDAEAVKVHGISNDFLADKPRFADVEEALLDFIRGAELIIHNAAFDLGFLNHELNHHGLGREARIEDICAVLDTLGMARRLHPGQRNTLDALCKRYQVDNAQRTLHGALLDAEILADVYLAMTGGQVALSLESQASTAKTGARSRRDPVRAERPPLRVIRANEAEQAAHDRYLDQLENSSGGACVWLRLDAGS